MVITLFLEDDKVYSWGSNVHGQCGVLGVNDQKFIPEPVEIEALRGVPLKQVCCGETHSMALDKEGNVFV